MADQHYRLSLQTRQGAEGERREMLRQAAQEAAEAAARVLANFDYAGQSASVEFAVEYGVRSVAEYTPADRRSVVEYEYAALDGASDSDLDDEPSDEPDTAGPVVYGIYGSEV